MNKAQVVPLTYKPASKQTRKSSLKPNLAVTSKDSVLIGLTVRLQGGGGAAACYTAKSKVVLTGRDEVIAKPREYVSPFTDTLPSKATSLGVGDSLPLLILRCS